MRIQPGLGFAVIALASLSVATPAWPVMLLDTGTPTGGNPLSVRNQSSGYQTLAGAFSTTGPEVVTSVEAYLREYIGTVDYLITGQTNTGLPDVNNTLFSESLTLSTFSEDWYGPAGLNWSLPAGDYYLVLSPQPDFASGMTTGAPNPTTVPFTNNSDLSGWSGATTRSAGFRVTAVPEPATATLAALGAAALLFRRRPAA